MNNKLITKIYITLSILIIIFLFGILMNLLGKILYQENRIFDLQVELDSEKEVVYQQKLQLNSYEEQFNRITIEERREAK